jgi:predicted porin
MLNVVKSRYAGKNLTIALLVSFFAIQLSAQDISNSQTVNYSQKHFYADLVSKAATLNGSWGLFGGMRAGYNINDNVSLGLIAHGLIPNKLGNSYINRDYRDTLHVGYGGVEATYRYDLSDRFYLAGIMMIGAGRVDYEILGGNDYFFIMEPGASINYRLIDWFGLGYSVNYRFASGVKYADFSNASFSGWSTTLDFKFGFDLY